MNIFEPEDYLRTVEGWSDPNPAPWLVDHEGVLVVRDDVIPGGSKSRFIDHLISRATDVDEWVYGNSPRWGYGQLALSHVCRLYGKKNTVFLAASNELHPNSALAAEWGTQIIGVPLGFMTVCAARARAYVNEGHGRRQVPFGLAHETVYGSIIKVARSIPVVPDEVWTVAGSGTLNRGLQMAWPDAEIHAIEVGHKLTDEEIGRAIVHKYETPFAKKCKKELWPPFPSVGEYDAKAWAYVKERVKPGRTVLLWNVAGDVG
jgi:hypothetical protein